MTNYQRWLEYTAGLSSPQNYIDWAWYFLVGAALQRRVWVGPAHQPIFANKFVIFVGEPGVGKGLPIREVSTFLKHWKKKDMIRLDPKSLTQEQQKVMSIVQESDQAELKKMIDGKAPPEPLLFPVAADATTYEALVQSVAEAWRRIEYIDENKKIQVYSHSSTSFLLQELASLMRKRTEDTVNLLLGLYDCPADYTYRTKTQGEDLIKRGCVNILAGTTPSFMQSTFDDKLADEGFNSRTFYVYAAKNRKNQFFIPLLTQEQEAHKKVLLEHIRQLSGLYGHAVVEPEVMQKLQDWWDDREKNRHKRPNQHIKLKPYYSRGNIHVMKLAMSKHFGESLEMRVPWEAFEWAIEFSSQEEKNMHLAITMNDSTPESKCARKIIELLNVGDRHFVDILVQCHHIGNKKIIEDALDFLKTSNQIESYQKEEEVAGEQQIKIYYKIKEQQ